ncbi:MAG: glycosyltransferase family A protein [Planctomycetota bacterium]
MSDRYVIITPCRNEAKFARKTLDSVVNQAIQPALWVIVDDGSTDETPAILDEYAAKHDFIRVVHRTDRGTRSVGGGVVEAFNAGLETVDLNQFDFLCKLDLDLILPPRYFPMLMARMHQNPRLGSCSGKPYYVHPTTGILTSEGCGDETSIGASKFYRVTCFRQIGGFVPEVMWDGIDCHRCRMLGWIACSWDEPELRFVHLRPMGSSVTNIFTGRLRWGFGQYFMGTGLTYMLVSALFRMSKRPYLVGGLCMLWGYVRAWRQRTPRYADQKFRTFIHRYQRRCLIYGKRRATEITNSEQATQFKQPTVDSGKARRLSAICE